MKTTEVLITPTEDIEITEVENGIIQRREFIMLDDIKVTIDNKQVNLYRLVQAYKELEG